jgi:hypothetical protein
MAAKDPEIIDGTPPPLRRTSVPKTSGVSKKLILPRTSCGIFFPIDLV